MKIISFKRCFPSNAIRSREDIISVILQANEYLLCDQFDPYPDTGKANPEMPLLFVDKMSRLFIPENGDGNVKKAYSIVFPFSFNINSRELSLANIVVTDSMNACLKAFMNTVNGIFPDSIDSIYDYCWSECETFSLETSQRDLVIAVLTELLLFDIGYIRYDYDEEHENGSLHPLNHLDINFDNQSTYKIGLHAPIDLLGLHSILDSKQPCWFLKS